MRKKLPIGISNYREVKEDNRYYIVDKSKTIEEFLDITKGSKEIFQDTHIMKTEYAYYLNLYPAIFLSFAGAKGEKHKNAKVLKLTLLEVYTKYEDMF